MIKKIRNVLLFMAILSVGFLSAGENKALMSLDFETLPAELKGSGRLIDSNHGKALKLEQGAYLQYAASAELQAAESAGSFTFECWFFREEDDEHGFLIRHNGSFGVRVIPWDPRRINIGIFIPGSYISLDSEPCLKSGVWQHVAVVISPKEAELWIDGHLKMKKALKHPPKASRHPVVIGAGLEGNGKIIAQFPVAIDRVKIYSGAPEKKYFDSIAADATENFEARHTTVGMPPVCAEGKVISEHTLPVVVKGKNELTISNSFYSVVLQTAPALKIKKLYNKFTGSECFSAKGSPLFAVSIGDALKRVNPDSFKVKSLQEKKVGKALLLEAVLLHPSGVEMELRLTFDESEDISVNGTLRNGKSRQRLMAALPLLENISIGKDFTENWYFNSHVSGWAGKKSYEIALAYGFRSWLQFAAVYSPALGGGLTVTGQDTAGTVKGIATRKTKKNGKVGVTYNLCWGSGNDAAKVFEENSPGCGMGFIFRPDYFDAGEKLLLPPAKISVHRGSVLNPLMRYAKWSKQAFPHTPIPESAKKEFNYAAVHRTVGNAGYFKGFETPQGMVLSDKIAADGSDHQLQLAFWWKRHDNVPTFNAIKGAYLYKNSSGEGDYLYDPAFGGKEGMRKEIEKCREKGTNVVLYTCSRVVGDDSEVAKKHPEWALFSAPGKANRSWGCFNVCTAVPQWQDMYAAANARIVRDLPVSGVYLDTTAEVLNCYNTAHSHPRNPADSIKLLLKKVRDRVKAENPGAVIMTEYIGSEAFGMYIDACWVQTFAHPYAHAFNNYDLDFARFVYPKVKFAEWGMGPKTFEVDSRRAFFNGIGATRGDLKAEQKARYALLTNAQRELYDALASENPEPFVASLSKFVFINFFPGTLQKAWTYYNKAGALKNAPLLSVAASDAGKRFVEVVSDREIPVKDGKISLDMAELEVGMIAAFDPILKVEDKGGELLISLNGKVPAGAKVVYIDGGKRDSRDNFKLIDIVAGKGRIGKEVLAKGKLLIKLYNKDLLLDEAVLSNN